MSFTSELISIVLFNGKNFVRIERSKTIDSIKELQNFTGKYNHKIHEIS